MNRLKGFGLVETVPEELWTEVCSIVQEAVTKAIPWKRNARRQSDCLRRPYKKLKKEEKQKARRNTQLNAEFQRREKGDKKAFFNEKCKNVEENNRMGKARDLFKKIGEIKRTLYARMSRIKDRNSKDLTEAEEIKMWKEYTKNYARKFSMTLITRMVLPFT